MPIYEFFCPGCNCLLQFFSRRPNTALPECPHCKGALSREVSPFQLGARNASDELGDAPVSSDIEKAVAAFEKELPAAQKAGPQKLAALLREVSQATGLTFQKDLQALLARAEKGEDVNEDFDRIVDAGEIRFAPKDRSSFTQKQPPRKDPELYEMPSPPLPKRKPSAFD